MRMSWAKLPSFWLRPITADQDGRDQAPRITEGEQFLAVGGAVYPLKALLWRKDGSSSMAALMVLMALAIRLNKSLTGREFKPGEARPTTVAATYDELQRMTGFARGSISSGIALLVDLGAIRRVKVGRANQYEVVGLGENGQWCQLPQTSLLSADGTLSIKALPRKRVTLHALKIYMVLLALRNQKLNSTSISYTAITKWTGVRREDIGPAITVLVCYHLVAVVDEVDERYFADPHDRSKRYRVEGLKAIHHQSDATDPRAQGTSIAPQQPA